MRGEVVRRRGRFGGTAEQHAAAFKVVAADVRAGEQRLRRALHMGQCGKAAVELYKLGIDVGMADVHRRRGNVTGDVDQKVKNLVAGDEGKFQQVCLVGRRKK
jgi:hypothetical protein